MKNIYILTCIVLELITYNLHSQSEELSVWKNGSIINTQSTSLVAMDSITFTKPEVTICNQIWSTKNLDVTTYRNGDVIPQVTDPTAWTNLTTGAWCYYDNNPANGPFHGKLYNWYAVTDTRGLAPVGWHVPSYEEWVSLIDCLGGEQVAGGKMKSTGTIESDTGLWFSPNYNALNSSGFIAQPGGNRSNFGSFSAIGTKGNWWSSTMRVTPIIWYISINYVSERANSYDSYRGTGFSVRCLRD